MLQRLAPLERHRRSQRAFAGAPCALPQRPAGPGGPARELGEGVTRSEREAAAWYRKAAQQGEVPAQLSLGLMYRDGRGVSRNPARATFWLGQAARNGDAEAQLRLGEFYAAGGTGDTADPAEAYRWAALAERRADDDGLRREAEVLRQGLRPKLTAEQIAQIDALVENWRPAAPGTTMP